MEEICKVLGLYLSSQSGPHIIYTVLLVHFLNHFTRFALFLSEEHVVKALVHVCEDFYLEIDNFIQAKSAGVDRGKRLTRQLIERSIYKATNSDDM